MSETLLIQEMGGGRLPGSPVWELLPEYGAPIVTLEQLVICSLFCDGRAPADAELPSEDDTDRRGFWGDTYPVEAGDTTGSLLWLYTERAFMDSDIVRRVEQAATDALRWLVNQGIAKEIHVTTERDGHRLGLAVVIESGRWSTGTTVLKWRDLWEVFRGD